MQPLGDDEPLEDDAAEQLVGVVGVVGLLEPDVPELPLLLAPPELLAPLEVLACAALRVVMAGNV